MVETVVMEIEYVDVGCPETMIITVSWIRNVGDVLTVDVVAADVSNGVLWILPLGIDEMPVAELSLDVKSWVENVVSCSVGDEEVALLLYFHALKWQLIINGI